MNDVNNYFYAQLLTEQIIATGVILGLLGFLLYIIVDEIKETTNKISFRVLGFTLFSLLPIWGVYETIMYWINRIF